MNPSTPMSRNTAPTAAAAVWVGVIALKSNPARLAAVMRQPPFQNRTEPVPTSGATETVWVTSSVGEASRVAERRDPGRARTIVSARQEQSREHDRHAEGGAAVGEQHALLRWPVAASVRHDVT